MAADHLLQVQGSLLVTGRSWWSLVSYCPGLPPHHETIWPDARIHEALRSALADLRAFIERGKARLLALGCASELEAKRDALARAARWIDEAPDPVPEPAAKTTDDHDFEGEIPF